VSLNLIGLEDHFLSKVDEWTIFSKRVGYNRR
jgi:hypothetical protein